MSVSFSSSNDLDCIDEVNMANTHASAVLALLGITEESVEDIWSGVLPAGDFLGRVLVAQALAGHDEGLPIHEVDTVLGRAYTSRREGYFDERLAQLREIAEKALAEGAQVWWG